MSVIVFISSFLCTFTAWGVGLAPGFAQDVRPIGVVQTIDTGARQIKIKTDAGPEMNITYEAEARFLQVSPGAKDLANASTITAADLAVGDRILARGRNGGDSSSFIATSIIVMSKADLAKKHAAERAEWERRGVAGLITSVNPALKEIMIKTSSIATDKPLVITFNPGAVLRRYAPDSVKFSDALPGRFEELSIGDQVRALGTINEDRSRFIAEELVSGSFRTIAATVVELDVGKSTIVITDLVSNKRVKVQITRDSNMRRLSPQVTQMLAARNKGATNNAPASAEGDRSLAASSRGSAGDAPQQSPRDFQSILEKLPTISAADLTAGDALIISCTNSSDPSRVTAITLLAGVEPLMRGTPKGGRTLDLGSWNIDLNMNVGLP